MEIERLACRDVQCSSAVYADASVHDGRLVATDGRVARDDDIAQQFGIPGVGREVDTLHIATLMDEDDIVFHELRPFEAVLGRCQFNKHTDAVFVAYLDVLRLVAHRTAQIGAVDIDAEARLVAFFELHLRTSHTVARAVEHPERLCSCRHTREHRVHTDGIFRECKEMSGRRSKRIVVGTGKHRQDKRGDGAEKCQSVFLHLYI